MRGWDRRLRVWGLLLVVWIAGEAVLGGWSAAEHTAALRWMEGYKSATGVGCCSERDCLPRPIAVLQLTGAQAIVRIGETVVQLPGKSVHATQDGQTYWCCKTDADGRCPLAPTPANTRCVFYSARGQGAVLRIEALWPVGVRGGLAWGSPYVETYGLALVCRLRVEVVGQRVTRKEPHHETGRRTHSLRHPACRGPRRQRGLSRAENPRSNSIPPGPLHTARRSPCPAPGVRPARSALWLGLGGQRAAGLGTVTTSQEHVVQHANTIYEERQRDAQYEEYPRGRHRSLGEVESL